MYMDRDLNYIFNYIKYYYASVNEFKNEAFLMNMCNKIRYSMMKSSFSERKLDFYIKNYIQEEFKNLNSESYNSFATIKNHIYLLMHYYKIYNGVVIENYNVLLYEITRVIASRYTSEDVVSGIYDSLIEDMFNCDIKSEFNTGSSKVSIGEVEVVDKDTIKKYVFDYLSNDVNKVFEFSGNINYLVEVITAQLFEIKVDMKKVLQHEYDDLINYFIRKNLFNIKYTKDFKEIYNLVYKFVVSSETYMNISNETEKIEEEVFRLSRYLMRTGHTKNDINSKRCNEIMENHIRIDSIMVNSKVCKQREEDKVNPNKIVLKCNNVVASTTMKPLVFKAVLSIMSLNKEVDYGRK